MVFVDTAYWIAIMNSKDGWHKTALRARAKLVNTKFVTTDGVLVEFLAYFSGKTPFLRSRASEIVRRAIKNPNVEVIFQTRAWFLEGLELYEKRPDKKYSLQDCISMEIMRSKSIKLVLTSDRDFEQEGFTILMGK